MRSRSIIHLSDLHIGKRRREATRTGEIVDWLAENYPGSPVLVTGDVTQSGYEGQLRSARRLLKRLARTNPVLAVPGNHDYAVAGTFWRKGAWDNWIKLLGTPLGWDRPGENWMYGHSGPDEAEGLGVWEDDEDWIVYFGIDSGDPKNEVHTSLGYISRKLATALKKKLRQHEGKVRVVLLHHHPFTKGLCTKLVGADRLMSALKDNCEVVLFGHHHHFGIWWAQYGHILTLASHKSTSRLIEDYLCVSVVTVRDEGRRVVSCDHGVEVIP